MLFLALPEPQPHLLMPLAIRLLKYVTPLYLRRSRSVVLAKIASDSLVSTLVSATLSLSVNLVLASASAFSGSKSPPAEMDAGVDCVIRKGSSVDDIFAEILLQNSLS